MHVPPSTAHRAPRGLEPRGHLRRILPRRVPNLGKDVYLPTRPLEAVTRLAAACLLLTPKGDGTDRIQNDALLANGRRGT